MNVKILSLANAHLESAQCTVEIVLRQGCVWNVMVVDDIANPPYSLPARQSEIKELSQGYLRAYGVFEYVSKYAPVLLNASSLGAKKVNFQEGYVSNALENPCQILSVRT